MMSLWTVGTELSALGLLAVSTPLHPILARDHFAATPTYPTPVLLVHGLLGSPTNFLRLRRVLSARGVGNLASFSYRPALDHQRLTLQLRDTIEAVCLATGSDQLDVVGHSLGGVLARYLLEVGDGGRVRRLVTLGAPSLTGRLPDRELAIFGADDPLVSPPSSACGPRGRVVVIPDCGHWGLLFQHRVLRAVERFLTCSTLAVRSLWTSRAA